MIAALHSQKMSTASKKKSADDHYPLRDGETWNYSQICNAAGIKSSTIWKLPNRYDFTYFLLPSRWIPSKKVPVAFDNKEFIGFWHKLDDNHKERRLLANYMCAIRTAEDKAKSHDGTKAGAEIKAMELLFEKALTSDLSWTFRRLFVEDQRKRDRRGKNDGFNSVVEIFLQAHIDVEGKTAANLQCFRQYFEQVVIAAIRKVQQPICKKCKSEQLEHVGSHCEEANDYAAEHWKSTFDTFIQWYAVWKSLNEKGKRRYLAKLRVSMPHWRQEDRDALSKALETKGESCRGTYVERLLNAVGPKRFKVIIFGDEKFCAACNCSSYVKRLWSCQRCANERLRPKARYCGVDCQKADWLNHKAKAHSGK